MTILREPILKTIGRSLHHRHGNATEAYCDTCALRGDLIDGVRVSMNGNAYDGLDQTNFPSTSTGGRTMFKNDLIESPTNTNHVIIDKMQHWRLADDSRAVVDFRSLANDCSELSLEPTEANGRLHKANSFRVIQANAGTSTDDGQNVGSNAAQASAIASTATATASSSTCSQQVRMHSTNNCDVTIDELASYFETFVHIPKKMSSMAEMMYT